MTTSDKAKKQAWRAKQEESQAQAKAIAKAIARHKKTQPSQYDKLMAMRARIAQEIAPKLEAILIAREFIYRAKDDAFIPFAHE
jgi:tagatose-1,6-bisphosphate aldolase